MLRQTLKWNVAPISTRVAPEGAWIRNFLFGTACLVVWTLIFAASLWSAARPARAQGSASSDLAYSASDLDFILEQIKIAERHAAGEDLADILPNLNERLGLRTVDGSFNSLIPG